MHNIFCHQRHNFHDAVNILSVALKTGTDACWVRRRSQWRGLIYPGKIALQVLVFQKEAFAEVEGVETFMANAWGEAAERTGNH